jgi:hypothetical protein
MVAGREEFAEAPGGIGDRIRGGDAGDIEAGALAVGDQRGLRVRRF